MVFLQKVLQMGLVPLFLTNKPERYRGLEAIVCPILVCNTNDLDALLRVIERGVDIAQVCGVTTTSEFYLEAVARIVATYGFPGNPPEAVRRCRNKALTREVLQASGVRQPRFVTVQALEEMAEKLPWVGVPCIVKPADDTGSDKVLLCQDEAEAMRQARLILDTVINVRGQPTDRTALLEAFLDGPEYSVETFSLDGTVHCIGVTEKRVTGFPFFVEEQHIFPAPLPAEVREEMVATARTALTALGLRSGPAHTEVKLTREGCIPVEVNARLAGGMIPELMRLVTNVDMLEAQLQAATGRTPRLPDGQQHGYAGIRFLLARKEGRLRAIEGLAEARAVEHVRTITLTARVGDRVLPPRSAYERLGYVIAHAPTAEAVARALDAALERLILVIDE
uniref:ATP-grasp domain-containing protein n=1 Tax=Thermosporothrix sp. COM3 TaxID=2490863 RepID=A0A455SL33_9CHLR|nr:hypothetical protein KTC_28290 [Thermosporothrix sp. COM3]